MRQRAVRAAQGPGRRQRHQLVAARVHVAADAAQQRLPAGPDPGPVAEQLRVVRHVAEASLAALVHRAHLARRLVQRDRLDERHARLSQADRTAPAKSFAPGSSTRGQPDVEEARAALAVAADRRRRRQDAGDTAGRDDAGHGVVDRRLDLRVVHLPGEPHRLGEVAGRHEEDVHVLDLQDVVEVGERLDLLQHDHDHGLLVRAAGVVGHLLAERGAPAGEAAVADRRELGVTDRGFGLGPGVHVGDLDAAGAAVEGPGDRRGVVGLDPHDRRGPDQLGRADHVLDRVPAGRPVLAVEEDHVEAHPAQQLHQARRAVGRVDDAHRLAGGQLPFGRVVAHGSPPRSGFRDRHSCVTGTSGHIVVTEPCHSTQAAASTLS